MYKIYINENPLYIISDVNDLQFARKEIKAYRYLGKPHDLLNFIDKLEKSGGEAICIYDENVEKLWEDFQSVFKTIHAAGGIVMNQKELLMIYRLEMWDLPKGKVEKNEGLQEAALREITEETGLSEIEISHKLCITYHTYRLKSRKRVLKHNHWYLVESQNREFTPQEEEGITEGTWLSLENAEKMRAYKSIREVLNAYKSTL